MTHPRSLLPLVAALALAAGASAQTLQFPAVLERPSDAVLEKIATSDAIVTSLELPRDAGEPFAFPVYLEGAERAVTLWPHSVLADDYRLMVLQPDGTYVQVEAPPSTTYRGTVEGLPESAVAASLVDGRLEAVIETAPDEPLWGIQPLGELQPGAPAARHVVYSMRDAMPLPVECGATEDLRQLPIGGGPGGTAAAGAGGKICQIACDADFEFFQKNGSSVSSTQTDITNVINAVEVIYDNDVDIEYEITVIYVEAAEPDPYSSTNPSTLLSQFRNHWNASHGADQRDVAHLFTGKNLSGSTIGIAFLNVVCNLSQAYGLAESRFTFNMAFRTALSAHEIGHNWNASHCNGTADCRIMCSGLGGCTGIISSFGPVSKNSINNKKASAPCLEDAAPPTPPVLTTITPSTLEAFGSLGVTLNGSGLASVTQVDVGGTTLVPPLGVFLISDSEIVINAPAPTSLGSVQVTATNPLGTSNPKTLTYVATDPPLLSGPALGISGSGITWNFGSQASDLWFLFFAGDSATFPFGGASLLANGFLLATGVLSPVGVGSHNVIAPPGLAGLTFWSQVVVIDPGTGGFTGATNVLATTFLL